MTLLEQCQQWHEHKEYRKIICAIQSLPKSQQNVATDMELARAYNNIADPDTIEGQQQLRLAINILLQHEAQLANDYNFNFRLGYAFYYTDDPVFALRYFQRAYTLHRDDNPLTANTKAEIQFFIDDCLRVISLPLCNCSFKDKIYECINTLFNNKNTLEQQDNDHELLTKILNIAFKNLDYDFLIKDNTHTLILYPNRSKANLFKYIYFRHIFNEFNFTNWQLQIGYNKTENAYIKVNNHKISTQDISVHVVGIENNSLCLQIYSNKLSTACNGDDELFYNKSLDLIQQALGDMVFLIYVTQIDVINEPCSNSISLADLYVYISQYGLNLNLTDQDILETFSNYSVNSDLIPKCTNNCLRHDIVLGTTNHGALTSGFLVQDYAEFDSFYQDCAVAAFICCKLDDFGAKDNLTKFIKIKDELVQFLNKELSPKEYWVSGYAFGINYGYFDFIAWDLHALMTALLKYIRLNKLSQVAFHVFDSCANTISLGENTFIENFVVDTQFLTQINPFNFFENKNTAALSLDTDKLKLKHASDRDKIKFLEDKIHQILDTNFNVENKKTAIKLDSSDNLLCVYSQNKRLLHDLSLLLKDFCINSKLL